MERTPDGTPVGVDDPYAVAGVCDHLTDDGRCRFALTRAGDDPEFAADRRADDYGCHVGADGEWSACPHYRSTTDGRECRRCGLEEVRVAHGEDRPLVEEHHLSYGSVGGGETGDGSADGDEAGEAGPHEITVALCRWCHAKVHKSFARIDDDASPDPEAIAQREARNDRQQEELSFGTAAERFDTDDET
jgi:ribosomal protein L40E